MNKTIADRFNEQRGKSLYVAAASKFNVSYHYAYQIASGIRKATRGNGKEIREWMEGQVRK